MCLKPLKTSLKLATTIKFLKITKTDNFSFKLTKFILKLAKVILKLSQTDNVSFKSFKAQDE